MYIPSRLYVYADEIIRHHLSREGKTKDKADWGEYPVFDLLLIDLLKEISDRAGLEYLALPEFLKEEAGKPGIDLLYFSHETSTSARPATGWWVNTRRPG